MTHTPDEPSEAIERVSCPGGCGQSWPAPPPLPEGVDQAKVLDAFYSAVPEHFGSCFGDPKGERHGTVAAAIPLAPNDLAYLRGIRAAIAAMQSVATPSVGEVRDHEFERELRSVLADCSEFLADIDGGLADRCEAMLSQVVAEQHEANLLSQLGSSSDPGGADV